ncbi:MAG TPA: ABC transporter permease [Bryobacteraceae bacterium]|nr:ABC transporter permease [Bryobacteraceae bacterium]
MGTFSQDFHYSLRAVRSNPGFAFLAVLSLGLGIGANTAIFTLMDQVLLRLLPVKNPHELAMLSSPGPRSGWSLGGPEVFSYPMYRDLRDRNEVFSNLAARFESSVSFAHKAQTERVQAELVSGNYFQTLGVEAVLGRTFTPDDDKTPGAHPVVVLSHGFWQRRFGGTPSILNETININGHPMTVIGVASRGFQGFDVARPIELFLPLAMKKQATPTWDEMESRQTFWLTLVGRLKPGVDRSMAAANLNIPYAQVLKQEIDEIKDESPSFATQFLKRKVDVLPADKGRSGLRERFSAPLIVLMAMVGMVLLIACANVASLLTARAARRQKEIAIRLALGASRGQIVRQLVVEGLFLAVCGGALGILVALWTGEGLLQYLPFDSAGRAFSASPDQRVLLFTLSVSLIAGVLFSLAPALQATRPDVAPTLKDQALSVSSNGSQVRFRRGLVTAQFALSLLLLVGTGLFARSLYNLRSLDPGIETSKLMTFAVDPTMNGYSQDRTQAYFRDALQKLQSIPGVQSASVMRFPMLSNAQARRTVFVQGYRAKDDEDLNPGLNSVTPGHFANVGVPILAGRDFTDADRAGAPKVMIINQSMAKYFFGKENPVGRMVALEGPNAPPDHVIVGVVKDSREVSLREAPTRTFYTPLAQEERIDRVSFYVRTSLPEQTILPAIRKVMRASDANLPLWNVRSLKSQVDETHFIDRLIAVLAAAFGLLATILAAVGLYGITAYSVARRTREFGIRVALGAKTVDVLALVLKEVAIITGLGIAIGIPVAILLSRFLKAQLYGLEGHDPLTFALASVSLVVVAFTAGIVPATRAAGVEPLHALHHD